MNKFIDCQQWAVKQLTICERNNEALLAIKQKLTNCCVYDDNLKKMYELNILEINRLKSFIAHLSK